ncbi:MAG: nucleoside triphosphate pyrophosphatase [Pseudomonadota bacterium]|nr:nucleoside triphosphate pyrophosphatase [Pseudomonadota bacterium]
MTGLGGQKPLTLASGSQVRAALMRGAGLKFDIAVSGVDEDAIKARHGGTPDALALKLAEAKARAIARDGLVVGADQILVCDGVLFDKPKDMVEARENLKKFRGRTHALVSGTVLLDDGKPVWSLAEQVTLTMRQFSDEFLEAYLLDVGDDVLKSVGCYQLEGPGVQLFEAVNGDYFAILGLPLVPLLAALRARGAVQP